MKKKEEEVLKEEEKEEMKEEAEVAVGGGGGGRPLADDLGVGLDQVVGDVPPRQVLQRVRLSDP